MPLRALALSVVFSSLVAVDSRGQNWLDTPVFVSEPGDGEAYAVGDHDGDGDADILFAERGAGSAWAGFRVLRNDGSGGFAAAQIQSLPGSAGYFPVKAPMADVTGDGLAEVFFGRAAFAGGTALLVFPGGPSGTAGAPIVLDLPAAIDAVVVGDNDGDSQLEFATLHGQNQIVGAGHEIRWWKWSGSQFVPSASVQLPAPGFGDGGVAGFATLDFSGDGSADLVVGESQGKDLIFLQSVGGAQGRPRPRSV